MKGSKSMVCLLHMWVCCSATYAALSALEYSEHCCLYFSPKTYHCEVKGWGDHPSASFRPIRSNTNTAVQSTNVDWQNVMQQSTRYLGIMFCSHLCTV